MSHAPVLAVRLPFRLLVALVCALVLLAAYLIVDSTSARVDSGKPIIFNSPTTSAAPAMIKLKPVLF
jgi:hypothetical protein